MRTCGAGSLCLLGFTELPQIERTLCFLTISNTPVKSPCLSIDKLETDHHLMLMTRGRLFLVADRSVDDVWARKFRDWGLVG